jgi:hypothetical protein
MEIKDYQENSDKNRRNGKLGGRPSKTQSVSSGLPKESQAKGNHKPLTINHKPKTTNQVNTPEGVSQNVWQEFVDHRKTKKVTQLVIDGIQAEADKAGFTLEDALKESVVRGWQSFKAEWVVEKKNNSETVYQRSMRIKMQQAVPDIAAKQPNQYEDVVEFFRTIEVPAVVKQIGGAK